MQTLLQDLHYSLRQLVRIPRFFMTAVISLALGIGAATAVFSVVYAALLNPYPYPHADRIVRFNIGTKTNPDVWMTFTGPQVMDLRRSPVVETVLAMDYHSLTLTGREFPEEVKTISLIANGFNDLGLPPILGRGLEPSDAVDGQDPQPVVVLSYRFWQQHYFGDTAVLGKTLQLDHKSYTIVGVAAPRFIWYTGDVYLPLGLAQVQDSSLMVDLRLKPGIGRAAATAALQPLLDQFLRDQPKQFPKNSGVHLAGLNDWVVKDMGSTLDLLFGAVMLLLAIGCGNVSILLLARGSARQHELAVRSALGANRRRIVRQLLTESLLLSLIGAGLGVPMAFGILAAIKILLPRFAFAPEVVIGINIPVLLFSVAAALATGILFGLWPAWKLSRPEIGPLMQSGTRRTAGSVAGRRAHTGLIAGQMALTLLLLAAAGSAMQGFARLMRAPLGYDPHNVMSVGFPLHQNAYTTWPARAVYFEQLRAKVAEAPGVTMAAISTYATPPRSGWGTRFEVSGQPSAEQQHGPLGMVSQGYFRILGIPLLQGRLWDETEERNGAPLAVINQTMAHLHFPSGDAIGHTLKLPEMEQHPPQILTIPRLENAWLTIVGVVGDARNDGLRNPVRPEIYIPYTLSMADGAEILVRSQPPPLTLLRSVRKQIGAVNAEQQTYGVISDLDTWISEEPEWQQGRLVSWIFGAFAVLALVLAAVGLSSVVAYTVAQRTGEFGIRMALGARRGHLLRIVFASTLISIGGGVFAGLALTLALNRIVAGWAQGNPSDPVMLLASTLLLGLVSAIACLVPALRTSQIDPMAALRSE